VKRHPLGHPLDAPPWRVRSTPSNQLVGRFGKTRDGGAKLHAGIDWAAPLGQPVFAAHPGVVATIGWEVTANGPHNAGYGQRIVLRGDAGVETRYAHLSYLVPYQAGMLVQAGELLGHVGHSGNAEPGDEHLHFEVRISGKPVNPLWWLGYSGEVMDGMPDPRLV